MSAEAMKWAWEQDCSGTKKLILVLLSSWAGPDQTAWPSVETIAHKCRVSTRSVRQALKALEEGGLIVRARQFRQDGSQRANLFTIPCEEPQAGVKSASPQDNKKDNKTEETTADPEVEQLWAAILEKCPPAVTKLSDARRKKLQHAINEAGLELCIRSLDGLLAYIARTGKGEPDWTRALTSRPKGDPLPDQIAWWASQAPGSSSSTRNGTYNHLLSQIHPSASDRLLREHHSPSEFNVDAAREIHEELARRGLVAKWDNGLKIVKA